MVIGPSGAVLGAAWHRVCRGTAGAGGVPGAASASTLARFAHEQARSCRLPQAPPNP